MSQLKALGFGGLSKVTQSEHRSYGFNPRNGAGVGAPPDLKLDLKYSGTLTAFPCQFFIWNSL